MLLVLVSLLDKYIKLKLTKWCFMRLSEILRESASSGGSSSGGIASIAKPLGGVLKRLGKYPFEYYDLGLVSNSKIQKVKSKNQKVKSKSKI